MPDRNGGYVTRAEMAAHVRRIDENVAGLRRDVTEHFDAIGKDVASIKVSLGAGPRWLGARANAVLDKILPTVIAIAAIWVLKGRL